MSTIEGQVNKNGSLVLQNLSSLSFWITTLFFRNQLGQLFVVIAGADQAGNGVVKRPPYIKKARSGCTVGKNEPKVESVFPLDDSFLALLYQILFCSRRFWVLRVAFRSAADGLSV